MGRKKATDPRVHLPNVTIPNSVVMGMNQIQNENPEFNLSEHYEFAIREYIEKKIDAKRLIILGVNRNS